MLNIKKYKFFIDALSFDLRLILVALLGAQVVNVIFLLNFTNALEISIRQLLDSGDYVNNFLSIAISWFLVISCESFVQILFSFFSYRLRLGLREFVYQNASFRLDSWDGISKQNHEVVIISEIEYLVPYIEAWLGALTDLLICCSLSVIIFLVLPFELLVVAIFLAVVILTIKILYLRIISYWSGKRSVAQDLLNRLSKRPDARFQRRFNTVADILGRVRMRHQIGSILEPIIVLLGIGSIFWCLVVAGPVTGIHINGIDGGVEILGVLGYSANRLLNRSKALAKKINKIVFWDKSMEKLVGATTSGD